jgi:hypothetical protein
MLPMQVLEKYKVQTSSVVKAVQDFGETARARSDQLQYCNKFIKELGSDVSYKDKVDAEVICKALIERILMDQDDFNVVEGIKYAEKRKDLIKGRVPELWAAPEIEIEVGGKMMKKTANGRMVRKVASRDPDKKDAARKVYEANINRPKKDIIAIMAKELNITYANADYYVSRVFKKKV